MEVHRKADSRPHPTLLVNHVNGDGGPHATEAQRAAFELIRYATLLWRQWRLIAGATLVVAIAAGVYAEFLKTKVWCAQSLVTPVSPSENATNEVGGGMLDSLSGAGGLSALFGFAGQSDNAVVAQRYMAIMNSYAFTMSLVERYHLDRQILAEGRKHPARVTPWRLYRMMEARFRTEYDYKSGNLTLYFVDRDPSQAKRILGFYLDNLRDKLRNEEVQSAAEAALSLQQEVRKTSDSLLQDQLYELMARQVQREKLAQVQADFAFKVVEPPVVPDNFYGYGARYYVVLLTSLTLFALCAFLVLQEWIVSARAELVMVSARNGASLAPNPPQFETEADPELTAERSRY